MKTFSTFSALLALGPWLAIAAPNPEFSINLGVSKIKEQISLDTLAAGWTQEGPADPNAQLKLRFALKQKNIHGLLEIIENSNGELPTLSEEEINSYISPDPAAVSAVKHWLTSAGIKEDSIDQPGPDNLYVTLPLSKVESLLQAKYSLFSHPSLLDPVPRTLSYSLPDSLHPFIDIVSPTVAFTHAVGTIHRSSDVQPTTEKLSKRRNSANCDPNAVTVPCLLSYYYSDWTGTNQNGAQVGTAGINKSPASHSDMKTYQNLFQTGAKDFIDVSNSGLQPGTATLEGNLDTQYAGGMAGPSNSYYIYAQDISDVSGYIATQNSNAPAQISISYGMNEDVANYGAYMTRVCNDFALGLFYNRAVFVSSGDNGVGSASSCPNGFMPEFPSTCPYVTSVGATALYTADKFDPTKTDVAEISSYSFASGGGFSNYFAMPNYQKSAVQSYISSLNGKYDGQYNKSGRAYPDVSAIGQTLTIIQDGRAQGVIGTSASSPIWAGVASLTNDYLISKGKKPVVQWQYLVYQGGKLHNALKDVAAGSQQSCGTQGFPVGKGWDPVTGNGTPFISSLRLLADS